MTYRTGPVASSRVSWTAACGLATCAVIGIALVWLYPDSYQQDGGVHFLFARWAWHYRPYLVDEWGRPFFTLLYSVPAAAGYRVAKLTTVAICVATAWQTWRLAEAEGLERAPLVIALLWLQPSYLLLTADTMTEPLFALLFVVALRLRRSGHLATAASLISCAALTRPEGLVLAPLWAIALLSGDAGRRGWRYRLGAAALLALAPSVLWLITSIWTRDPLWVVRHWPANWGASAATYGKGLVLDYFYRRAEIFGPLLQVPFAVGVVASLVRRRLRFELANVVLLFVLHSALWALGAFGSAGYPRYFACVAPAIALIALLGWNELANAFRTVTGRFARPALTVATALVLLMSAVAALCYVDAWPSSRDAWMVDAAAAWFHAHPQPVSRVIASQAYGCIRFGCDPKAGGGLRSGGAGHLDSAVRALPPETLIIWDADTGPSWHNGLTGNAIVAAGFTPLWRASDTLRGRLLPHLAGGRYVPRVMSWGWGGERVQTMWLLYRRPGSSNGSPNGK